MNDGRIYLDNNATTFLDPRVLRVVSESLQTLQGNPSSVHTFGQQAKHALLNARRTIAEAIKVDPSEIVFFGGATEALNTLMRGSLKRGEHLITSAVEHAAVYATAKDLENEGVQSTFIEPGLYGAATVEQVEKTLQPNTRLIALMGVNNETGVKTDLEAVAELSRMRKIPLLVDGVAQFGKEPLTLFPDILAYCASGHKIHGPKGIAFAVVRRNFPFKPLLTGGEQEGGKRGGTENIPAIVGLAEAVRLSLAEKGWEKMETLRQAFETGLLSFPNVEINGTAPRTSNTTNATFIGLEGELLLTKLDLQGICVSHGSACASGALEPSRVLLNMGLPRAKAASALRFSFSRFNTLEEVERTLAVLKTLIR